MRHDTLCSTLLGLTTLGMFAACTSVVGDFHFVGSPGTGGAGGGAATSTTGAETSTTGPGASASSTGNGMGGMTASSTTGSLVSGSTTSGATTGSAGGGATTTSSATTGTTTTSSTAVSSSGATAVCGDGTKEPGEECDDGNVKQGDRCGPTCQIEDPTTCPGTPITLAVGMTVNISDTTSGASDKFVGAATVGNCTQSGNFPGSDLVYAVTPTADGMLNATLTASYTSHFLHVRTACPGASTNEIACQYGTQSGSNDNVKLAVTAGTTYYVVADSWASQAGAFTLKLVLQ